MDRHQHTLIYQPSSSRDFLLSKTDLRLDEAETETARSSVSDDLLNIFPGLLSGKSFLNQALEKLDDSLTFGTLVIKIDHFGIQGSGSKKTSIPADPIEVARTIDHLCQHENGIWGLLGGNLFGCYFLGKNGMSCLNLAQKLKQNLSERSVGTVSVGLASYPTINFKKDQIIENARKALDHAAYFGPDSIVSFDAVSLNISGDKLYDHGDIAGAVEEFKTALLLDPSNVNVHNSLGVCYGVMGDLEKALQAFENAIKFKPEEVMAVYNAGLVYALLGKKTLALEYLLKADHIDGDIFEVVFQNGRLFLEMNEVEKARPYLKKATKLKPDFGPAFTCLGDCYAAMNMHEKAVAAYKKAIKCNSNDAAALSALGWLFDAQGENPEIATLFCKQSVAIAPEKGLFRYRLGQLYLKENRLKEALIQFKEAARLGHDAKQYIKQIEARLISKAS